jgi:hypothetical protein
MPLKCQATTSTLQVFGGEKKEDLKLFVLEFNFKYFMCVPQWSSWNLYWRRILIFRYHSWVFVRSLFQIKIRCFNDISTLSSLISVQHDLILFEKFVRPTCIFTYTNEKKVPPTHIFTYTNEKKSQLQDVYLQLHAF